MSIVASELVFYTSANMPVNDTTTTGGTIENTLLKSRPVFTTGQIASNTVVVVTPTANAESLVQKFVRITGRTAAGAIVDEDFSLVSGSGSSRGGNTTFERILKAQVRLSSSSATHSATGDIAVRASAGTHFSNIVANESAFQLIFYDSASSTLASATRYEKVYAKNNNATLSLTNATVAITADPDAVIEWGYAVGSAQSVSNRMTVAPTSVTFIDASTATQVPAVTTEIATAGIIGPLEYSGIWIKQTLAQSNAALKSTFTLQIVGTST